MSGSPLRSWLCLAGLAAACVPSPAQAPQARTQPARPHRVWRLTKFTWVELVPREAGAPANEHPVKVPSAFLANSLAAIQMPGPDGDVALFSRDEIAVFLASLREAFAVAGPDQDLLLVSTYRRSGGIMAAPEASTSRLFWQGNTLQIIVHDARIDFMGAYLSEEVMPVFTFGSRSVAGNVQLQAAGAVGKRADWLAFRPQAVPAPAPVVAAAPVAAPVAPVAAPVVAPASPAAAPARDAAFFADREQRLRGLKHMRDENLITEEEYQKKRQEIISGL